MSPPPPQANLIPVPESADDDHIMVCLNFAMPIYVAVGDVYKEVLFLVEDGYNVRMYFSFLIRQLRQLTLHRHRLWSGGMEPVDGTPGSRTGHGQL